MQELLKNSDKATLLGNEAIVRGALEAGVQFATTYPGTPASEIGDTFARIAREAGVYFEYSTNEKVALEAAVGASFSGLKTLVAMKDFGLNVAADSLMPFCYTGTKGPTVIVVGDDPSCHSSAQSEQNTRAFASLAHIPILEPADPQECKDYTKFAFQLSARFNLPVLVRLTTRVAHQRMPVVLGKRKLTKSQPIAGRFVKDKKRFVTMPPRVLEMHKELLEKIEKVKGFAEESNINKIICTGPTRANCTGPTRADFYVNSKSEIGVITSGVSYLYVIEALQELKLNLPILKLGFFYPLAEEKIEKFIKGLKKVLIVEELEPYLEKEVAVLAREVNPNLNIFGKNVLSEVGELKPDDVMVALSKVTGKSFSPPKKLPFQKIKHLPRFCTVPVCPYWKLFAAVKKAAPETTIFGGDIGCYMMAALPPHNLYDYLSSMGSSIGIAHGIAKATGGGQKVIAFMGDSTFFHAGIPALINTRYNKSNPLIIILDNAITAMTGHQPHPGMGKTGMGEEVPAIKIENIIKALQIKHLKVLDPEEDFDQLVKTIKEFLPKKEVSVIIARKLCALLAKHKKK